MKFTLVDILMTGLFILAVVSGFSLFAITINKPSFGLFSLMVFSFFLQGFIASKLEFGTRLIKQIERKMKW